MANTQRFSISADNENAVFMRELVEKGTYPPLSSAYNAAAEALREREAEKAAWWEEAIRRCEEAERYPEKLLDVDTFFQQVREEIKQLKKSHSV